jgi:hypothetical protein
MAQTFTPVENRLDVPFDAIKAYAAESYKVDISDIQVLSVENGYGVHKCTERCLGRESVFGCMLHHNDSDWIVTVQYDEKGHQAVYGVLRGEFSLWMD